MSDSSHPPLTERSLEYRLGQDEQLSFIHIPKTAGTTLTALLNSKFHHHEICPAEVWSELVKIPPADLAKYRLFRGHFFYDMGDLLPRKPVYITMLRNPIERVISGYEFMRRCVPSRAEALPNHLKAQSMTLLEYVSDPENPSMSNSQTRHLSSGVYRDDPEQWLAVAKQHVEAFAFVGLVETFQDSMALLSYTFGWNPLAEFQNLMVAPRRLKQDQLEPEVLAVIAERNALDIALYDYAKELFQTRYQHMVRTLLERYGDIADTPNVAQMQTLLEQHYRQRYAELNLSKQRAIAFDFNQPLSGAGWHLREGGEGETPAFRWTGPGTTATLDLPLESDRDVVLEFSVINALAPDILESLTLQVNGQSVPLGVLYSHGLTIFQSVISQELLKNDPFTRLTFQVNRTISLQSLNPHDPDQRRVGLAFSSLQTFATDAAAGQTAAAMFASVPWQETVDFVQQHVQPGQKIFAPTVFRAKFPEQIPAYTSPLPLIRNYNPERSEFHWAILHKGMMAEIGAILGRLEFVPLYANEVFVVLGRRSLKLSAIAYNSPHVKPLYIGWLKHYVQAGDRPWNRLQTQLKRLTKQTFDATLIQTLKSIFPAKP